MRKSIIVTLAVLSAGVAFAQYEVDRTEELSVGALEGGGQITNPLRSPDGGAICFEYLAASGETLEVYVSPVDNPSVFPPKLAEPALALPSKKKDLFSLGGPGENSVSEQPTWGAPTRRGTPLVISATRREAGRGGSQINFDLYYTAKGKRRFLTEHPENDSAPAFSPDGESLVFASGRTGEGDLYVYSFYAMESAITRLTFEETGSELYPTWSPDGRSLAYIGHLGGSDHLLIIDDVATLLAKPTPEARITASRAQTRDLTAGWRHSSLAPSFSPDGKSIAFFMHPKGQLRTDLYVVKKSGGGPVLLMENVLAPTRTGPCWAPDGSGVFVVEENAQLMNPIVWVPLDPSKARKRLDTGTQLNTDLSAWSTESATYLMYAAQGGGEQDSEKRWRKIFVSRLDK